MQLNGSVLAPGDSCHLYVLFNPPVKGLSVARRIAQQRDSRADPDPDAMVDDADERT